MLIPADSNNAINFATFHPFRGDEDFVEAQRGVFCQEVKVLMILWNQRGLQTFFGSFFSEILVNYSRLLECLKAENILELANLFGKP